ncbi:MAG: DNA-processing protein DprA [Candidatus Saccharimonadales bacterium]
MNINTIRPDESIFLKRLTTIANPPKCLYYTGNLPTSPRLVVAIVGTRRPTAYGRAVTEQISSALAAHGVLIVSGLALGVDAIAHTAALRAGGHTIAVITSRPDDPTPRTNRHLAEQMIENGDAILSEHGEEHIIQGPWEFVIRNRLVSGLSDAVIVTEASIHSGTMSTVTYALEQGREVYAVPGPITSPLSAGCNTLIAQGANPIVTIDGLLESLGLTAPDKIVLGENDAETTLLQLLQTGIADGEELQKMSKLDVQTFSTTMTMLEIRGLIHPLGGNRWRL